MEVNETEDYEDMRHEDVRELLGRTPNRYLSITSACVLGLLVLALVISSFLQFPDEIGGDLRLHYHDPSTGISVPQSGRISHLYVANGDTVVKGQRIAEVQSSVPEADFALLNIVLGAMDTLPLESALDLLPDSLQLGELQATFEGLCAVREQAANFYAFNNTPEELRLLANQIEAEGKMINSILRKIVLVEAELQLSEEQLQHYEQFLEEKVIAKPEYNEILASYHTKLKELENLKSRRIESDLQVLVHETKRLEVQSNYHGDKANIEQSYLAALRGLKSRVAVWDQQYVMTTPIAGVVSQHTVISKGMFADAGQTLLTVAPLADSLTAYAYIEGSGMGKLICGQKVRLELDAYPVAEYGTLYGTVEYISLVPIEGEYRVTIQLPSRLITSYGVTITSAPKMEGTCFIITDSKSLLYRLMQRLRFAIDR